MPQWGNEADFISQNGYWSHYFIAIPCGMFVKYFFHKLKWKLLQMDLILVKINGKSSMLMQHLL